MQPSTFHVKKKVNADSYKVTMISYVWLPLILIIVNLLILFLAMFLDSKALFNLLIITVSASYILGGLILLSFARICYNLFKIHMNMVPLARYPLLWTLMLFIPFLNILVIVAGWIIFPGMANRKILRWHEEGKYQNLFYLNADGMRLWGILSFVLFGLGFAFTKYGLNFLHLVALGGLIISASGDLRSWSYLPVEQTSPPSYND